MHACMYVCVYVCTYVCMYVCMHVGMYVYMYIIGICRVHNTYVYNMRADICTYIYMLYIYTHTYTSIYIYIFVDSSALVSGEYIAGHVIRCEITGVT